MAPRSTKPWIAFSSRVVQANNYDEPRDALSQDWTNWTTRHGSLPLALPNDGTIALDMLFAIKPVLLVLTGGNDAARRKDGAGDFDDGRNQAEMTMIRWALEATVPILGICRGMHMLNLYHGGTVCDDLGKYADDHVAKTHRVSLENPLRNMINSDIAETNSFHRQGFSEDQVGANLHVCARCTSDGTVEAIAREDAGVIGIGWHPERNNPAQNLDDAILSRLVPELEW